MYKVVVDYEQSFQQMIAAGKYDWVDGDMGNLPICESGKVEITVELVHFLEYRTKGDAVLKNLESGGMRPATLLELLAFGGFYPEKQREYSIYYLDPARKNRDGNFIASVLYQDRFGGRRLGLFVIDPYFGCYCRVLAVRK